MWAGPLPDPERVRRTEGMGVQPVRPSATNRVRLDSPSRDHLLRFHGFLPDADDSLIVHTRPFGPTGADTSGECRSGRVLIAGQDGLSEPPAEVIEAAALGDAGRGVSMGSTRCPTSTRRTPKHPLRRSRRGARSDLPRSSSARRPRASPGEAGAGRRSSEAWCCCATFSKAPRRVRHYSPRVARAASPA